MEHGACTLDISSDEESSVQERGDRGKENVPPMDDVSQTSSPLTSPSGSGAQESVADMKRASRRRREVEEGACDVDRAPLGQLNVEDFWAEGCDGESYFLVPAEEEVVEEVETPSKAIPAFDFAVDVKGKGKEVDIDALMQKDDFEGGAKAAVLEPMEKVDAFDVWESGSAKGDD